MERGCVEWSKGWGNGDRWWSMERGMGGWRVVVENESEGRGNGDRWWRMRVRDGGMDRGGGE